MLCYLDCYVVRRFVRQPPVIGEIIAGLIMGPSALGSLSGWSSTVFPPDSLPTFILVLTCFLLSRSRLTHLVFIL